MPSPVYGSGEIYSPVWGIPVGRDPDTAELGFAAPIEVRICSCGNQSLKTLRAFSPGPHLALRLSGVVCGLQRVDRDLTRASLPSIRDDAKVERRSIALARLQRARAGLPQRLTVSSDAGFTH
jgi:hypothetical protein